MTLNNLASALLAAGRVQAAETSQRRALRILEEKLSPENPRIATACGNLADILAAKGDRNSAARLYQRALDLTVAAFGQDHPDAALYRDKLASLRAPRRQ
jgi:tetratricopeptide (TPR) repeat protein